MEGTPNTARVVFGPEQTEAEIKDEIWQYDFGQKLQIEGLSLPTAVEIHYAARNGNTALVRAGVTRDNITVAPIPDSILETKGAFYAYVFVTNGTSGETKYRITGYINRRPPSEKHDKPADQDMFHDVIKVVNEAVEKAIQTAALKADDLSLQNGVLQLLSGKNKIGNGIRLPTGGTGGREIELRNSGMEIQWRYTDENEWHTLVLLEDLRGPAGEVPDFEVRDGHLYAIYK